MAGPKNIGKYEILEEIGRGGFAVVYKARDPDLDRVVALKVLAPHLTWDPTFAERFRREAQSTARLRHPHVVTIHEVGQADEHLYIAMEYLSGSTLAELLKAEGVMPLDRALPILEQVADALDYAHGQDVIHRDVKPSNVMVEATARGLRVTLMDFGLVKAMESSESLTSAGTILGSPEYMAPEQADPDRKSEIGPATDCYALGVVAYHMLTGRVPFDADSPLAVMRGHADKAPPNPRDICKDMPKSMAQVLLKALFKSPRGRYPTAMAMVEALRRAQTSATREAEIAERKEEVDERQRARAVAEEEARPTEKKARKEVEQQRLPTVQPRRKRFPALGWVAVGALVLALFVVGVLLRPDDNITAPRMPTATATSHEATDVPLSYGRVVMYPDGALNRLGTSIDEVALSPDGEYLVTIDGNVDDGEIMHFYRMASLEEIWQKPIENIWHYSIAFSPDGSLLAIGSNDPTVRIRDASNGALLFDLDGHGGSINEVVFSPDGSTLASASLDYTVRLWDVESRGLLHTLEGHSDGATGVAFSPDGTLLASSSFDNTVRLWEAASGELLQTLEGHGDSVLTVRWSPDGSLLATASFDNTVKLWDAANGKLVQTLEGHTDRAVQVSFSPNGMLLASGSGDDTVRLWDISTGELLRTLKGHGDTVGILVFSPDGTMLITNASWDGTVIFWDLTALLP